MAWLKVLRHAETTLIIAALAICAACGPSPPPAVPAPTPVAVVPVGGRSVTSSPGRTPSAALLRHWAFGEAPHVLVYADLAGAFETELLRGLVPAVLALARSSLDDAQTACLRDAVASAKEVLAGDDGSGFTMLVRYDPAATKSTPRACVRAFGGAPSASVDGAAESYDLRSGKLVVLPGLFIFATDKIAAEPVLTGTATRTAPAELALAGDDQLAALVVQDRWLHARGGFYASKEHVRVDVDAELEDENEALKLEREAQGADGAKALGAMASGQLTADEAATLKRVFGGLSVARRGTQLSVALELREPPAEQVRALTTVASLAMAGLRNYLVASKSAEARNTLGHIAKDLATWWEREDPDTNGVPRTDKKLFSLPAVPKTVPRGTKVQTSPGDWKAWSKIRFEMPAPQSYQYEIKAAKDGQSAEILARGDLNGDGKTSLFKLLVSVQDGRLLVAPAISELNPEE